MSKGIISALGKYKFIALVLLATIAANVAFQQKFLDKFRENFREDFKPVVHQRVNNHGVLKNTSPISGIGSVDIKDPPKNTVVNWAGWEPGKDANINSKTETIGSYSQSTNHFTPMNNFQQIEDVAIPEPNTKKSCHLWPIKSHACAITDNKLDGCSDCDKAKK